MTVLTAGLLLLSFQLRNTSTKNRDSDLPKSCSPTEHYSSSHWNSHFYLTHFKYLGLCNKYLNIKYINHTNVP